MSPQQSAMCQSLLGSASRSEVSRKLGNIFRSVSSQGLHFRYNVAGILCKSLSHYMYRLKIAGLWQHYNHPINLYDYVENN